MLHIDGNVDKKFKPSSYYRSREIQVPSETIQTDISNYKVATQNDKHVYIFIHGREDSKMATIPRIKFKNET